MKLESAAAGGRDILAYPPIILDNVLETSTLIRRIFEEKERARVRDLAYSAEAYLARGLAELAIMKADELGIENIGFTGGVAYNEHIASTIVTRIRDEGFKAYLHRDVPPGDAGVSLGQAIAAIWRQR
jgi:hydrogenase maturation protein HypF